MKRWVKRTIWGSVISLLSLFILIVVLGGTLVWIVFTPARLTPIIETVATDYIDAKLTFESVELTAFSTFPNIGIRINQGLLRSTTGDSLAKTDTIVSFEVLDVSANPMDFIFRDKISIKHITLRQPTIYAYVDSSGKANWDVFKFSSADSTATDTTQFNATVALKKLTITDGRLIYDDRRSKLYAKADSLHVTLRGNMAHKSDVTMDLGFNRGLFWQQGDLLAKRVAVGMKLQGTTDPALHRVALNKAVLDINGIRVNAQGWIGRDSLDITTEVVSPTLKTVVKMLPRAYIAQADQMTADGKVSIDGHIYGGYTDRLPLIDVNLLIERGSFQYTGFQYGVDLLEVKSGLHIDLNQKVKSNITIERLHAEGAAIKLNLTGRSSNILVDPAFRATTDISLDFTKLAKTLPLEKEITMGGLFAFKGSVQTSAKSAANLDWSRIIANGTLTMSNLWLNDSTKNFKFATSSASVSIKHPTASDVQIEGILGNIQVSRWPAYRASLKEVTISATGKLTADTITSIKGTLGYKGLDGALANDTLTLHSTASKVAVNMTREKTHLRLRTDTIIVKSPRSTAKLLSTGVNMQIGKDLLMGGVSFAKLSIRTPHLPLRMSIDSTLIKVKNDKIDLSKARIHVGRSDLRLSGSVENLLATLLHPEQNKKLVVRGTIDSKLMDLNQLIRAIDKGAAYHQKQYGAATEQVFETTDNDTTSLPIIMIAPTIDARLGAQFGELRFGKLKINDAQGHVHIENGETYLHNLAIHYQGATLIVNTLYAPESPIRANTTLTLSADHIDINSLKGITPYIDSLSPMINSIEGMVGIHIAARAVMDTFLIPNFDRMEIAASLHGEKLVVMDNETFASIAKMLMFKNKKRNVIDSLDVQVVARNGAIEIFPFAMALDRYRVALGGTQHFDGTLNYHVSILKSPVPFKFGVNITGNFDHFKIDVGKTQYKELFPPDGPLKRQNPLYIETRKQIVAPLQEND